MKNASPEKKQSVLKTLAIFGFIGVIILLAWASIQLVQVVPSAFSSLASLAEGVNQYQGAGTTDEPTTATTTDPSEDLVPLTVTSNTTLLSTGNTVDLAWGETEASGSYTFSYECVPGLTATLIESDGEQTLVCDTNYNLGTDTSATLSLDSTERRFVDFRPEVSFLRAGDAAPSGAGTATVTVQNDAITSVQTSTTSPDTDTDVANPGGGSGGATDETDPAPSSTGTPNFEQEYVYTVPSSDPTGRVDLATRFLFTGTLTNDRFTPGALAQDSSGAIQFEVKNLGTKTSEEWTFTITLPNGMTYESGEQTPLKPNERAVLTLGFPESDVAQHTFVGEVTTSAESTRINNRFSELVNLN